MVNIDNVDNIDNEECKKELLAHLSQANELAAKARTHAAAAMVEAEILKDLMDEGDDQDDAEELMHQLKIAYQAIRYYQEGARELTRNLNK